MVDLNEKAPDFTLLDQNDVEVSLSDFSGQWLVIYFYPKDDTPGCTKEACDFTDGLSDFAAIGAAVLGVSKDDTKSHRKFIAKYNLGITLLSDPEKIVHKAYGAWGLKKNYGREYEGTIRSTFIISPDGRVVSKWQNVKVRSKRKSGVVKHSDIIQEKLIELQNS